MMDYTASTPVFFWMFIIPTSAMVVDTDGKPTFPGYVHGRLSRPSRLPTIQLCDFLSPIIQLAGY